MPVSQRVQMLFIFNDNVRILCLSCNVKNVEKLVRGTNKFYISDNVRILYIYRLPLVTVNYIRVNKTLREICVQQEFHHNSN
jgi:hypothetical protein